MEEMIEQTSRRLPALVLISQHLDGEGLFTVLDVGPGVSGTVSFFSQFRCRLYFLDLFDQLSEAVYDPFNDIPADVRFDGCLLWDYVHFLDEQQLTLFVQALRPFIHQCCPGKVAPSDGKSRPFNVLWPVLPGNDLKSRGRKWSPERSIRTRHNEG